MYVYTNTKYRPYTDIHRYVCTNQYTSTRVCITSTQVHNSTQIQVRNTFLSYPSQVQMYVCTYITFLTKCVHGQALCTRNAGFD